MSKREREEIAVDESKAVTLEEAASTLFKLYNEQFLKGQHKEASFVEKYLRVNVKSVILSLPVKIIARPEEPVKCIIDTGSEYSLITQNFIYLDTKNDIDTRKLCIPNTITLKGVNSYSTTDFIPLLLIEIAKKQTYISVHVLESFPSGFNGITLILGMDFLQRNEAIINFQERKFLIPWNQIEISF